MKEDAIDKLDTIDILTTRIHQAKSIANSLTYTGGAQLSHGEVNNILSGVTDLLEQALEAAKDL